MPINPPKSGQSRRRSKSHLSSVPSGAVEREPLAAPPSSLSADLEPNSIVTRAGAFMEPLHREAMIAEAAYFLAERRRFDPGHELEDWFEAEQQIDASLAHGEPPTLEPTSQGEDVVRSRH